MSTNPAETEASSDADPELEPEPLEPEEAPAEEVAAEAPRPSGLRLDHLLLTSTIALVVALVGLSGGFQVWTIQRDHQAAADEQEVRLQAQAKTMGRTLSRLLSLTAAAALRDNDYGALDNQVKSVAAENKLIRRLQILDAEGNVAAGTHKERPAGVDLTQNSARATTATFQGELVYEYEEPIDYGAGAKHGLLVLSYSLEDLQTELARLDESRRIEVRRATVRTLGLGAVFVALGALLTYFQSRRITRPLGSLTHAAQELARGNLESRVAPSTSAGREVTTLSIVFNQMAEHIQALLEEARQKVVLQKEVNLARAVQETLLPDAGALDVGPLRIVGRVLPADECGGDLWIRAPLDGGRLLLGIGDVTGHGLATALIASGALGGFASAVASRPPAELDPETVLRLVNRAVLTLARGAHNLSCATAVFDAGRGEVQVANGGHPFACAFNKVDGPVAPVAVRGPLLGRSADFSCKASRFRLRPNDVYVWYSDGLVEARDAAGAAFGWNRLVAAIEKHRRLDAASLRDALLDEVRAFRGDVAQSDDITLIVVEHRGDEARS